MKRCVERAFVGDCVLNCSAGPHHQRLPWRLIQPPAPHCAFLWRPCNRYAFRNNSIILLSPELRMAKNAAIEQR